MLTPNPSALKAILRLPAPLRLAAVSSQRPFSVLNRPPPNYEGHIPLTRIERGTLAIGSAVMSLLDPSRGGPSTQSPLIVPPPSPRSLEP